MCGPLDIQCVVSEAALGAMGAALNSLSEAIAGALGKALE